MQEQTLTKLRALHTPPPHPQGHLVKALTFCRARSPATKGTRYSAIPKLPTLPPDTVSPDRTVAPFRGLSTSRDRVVCRGRLEGCGTAPEISHGREWPDLPSARTTLRPMGLPHVRIEPRGARLPPVLEGSDIFRTV